MAGHIEMKRLAEDLDAVRATARHMLSLADVDWSDWETDFLEHMAAYDGDEPLSMRQREKLTDLRDRSVLARDHRGIAVPALVRRCFEAIADIEDEDDAAFVASLAAGRPTSLRRGQLHRLAGIAARLGVIERYMAPMRPAQEAAAPN